ncbi:MAG TPA: hypothetical protein VMU35_00910, partial [Methylomirabilota bacterium]|nr:hypothetical protein [Methylomirabilota bacterium]
GGRLKISLREIFRKLISGGDGIVTDEESRTCDPRCVRCGFCGAGPYDVCTHCSPVMMGICMSNG